MCDPLADCDDRHVPACALVRELLDLENARLYPLLRDCLGPRLLGLLVQVQLERAGHRDADPALAAHVFAVGVAILFGSADCALHHHRVLCRDAVKQVWHLELHRDADVFPVWDLHADHAAIHCLGCGWREVCFAIIHPKNAQTVLLGHAELLRVFLTDLVDDTRGSRCADERSRAADAVDRRVVAVALADVVHERRGAVCAVAHRAHGAHCSIHRDVVVLADLRGRHPRVDEDHADVEIFDLGGHVLHHLLVDADAVPVLLGEDHLEVAARVQEDLAAHFLRLDVVVLHRGCEATLHFLHRVFEVDDPDVARLEHGLAQDWLASCDGQSLRDLH